jgi:hypothetical protein
MASKNTHQVRLGALLDEVVGSGPTRLLLDEAIIRVVMDAEAMAAHGHGTNVLDAMWVDQAQREGGERTVR